MARWSRLAIVGGPIEGVHSERERVNTPLREVFFLRIRLVQPSES